jgi:exopolyphosphatase/guanosine-5'-triphosphate,3'-diphosphate pyrophosphatase
VRRGLTANEEIEGEKIAEVVAVVRAQLHAARELGAADIRGVATAAVRQASNRDALLAALRDTCGLEVTVLSTEEEARLAFSGAARTLDHAPSGPLGVVDVGGGSCEWVVGGVPDRVDWYASFPVGSGHLTDECLRSDPPSEREIAQARQRVEEVLDRVEPPAAACVVAVGGSATSLRRIAGPLLDASAFERVMALLAADRAADVAKRFDLDLDRVRLLPAGLLILQAAADRFRAPLEVANGGLREGLLLEASGA